MNERMLAALLGGLLLSLGWGSPSSACINTYREAEGPTRVERPSDYISRLKAHPEHDRLIEGPAPQDPGSSAGYKARSDYAAALVHRGESRKAVEILESVEAGHPGEYVVAANLGTAYELSGDLVQAHHWIQEGIRRNPRSHEGTEWLHLRILEARQALAQNPSWLRSHSVLGLDFGRDASPQAPRSWPKGAHDAEDVITALAYQLHERLAFVPPPDPLVGGMIADLADLLVLFRNVDFAIPVYKLALTYQPITASLVSNRLEMSEEVRRRRHPVEDTLVPLLGGIAAVTLLAAVLLVWRRGAR
ncbi:MAG TPA: hypothetical protein VG457_15260 [Planctomycetota bacterium]|jgi:hypothetical protein|nr:hypothetical protein [Planctomycetota bacterium]